MKAEVRSERSLPNIQGVPFDKKIFGPLPIKPEVERATNCNDVNIASSRHQFFIVINKNLILASLN